MRGTRLKLLHHGNIFPARCLVRARLGLRAILSFPLGGVPPAGRATRPALRQGTCPLEPFCCRALAALSFLRKRTEGFKRRPPPRRIRDKVNAVPARRGAQIFDLTVRGRRRRLGNPKGFQPWQTQAVTTTAQCRCVQARQQLDPNSVWQDSSGDHRRAESVVK